MECRQIIKTYQLYVDEEMDSEEQQSLKQHIEECPNCKFRVKFEMQFQTTISKNMKSKSAPSELEERIKQAIF